MLFVTFQCDNYLDKDQGDWRQDIKDTLNIPEEKNIYWCIPANSIEQFVLYAHTIEINLPQLFVMFESDNYFRIDGVKWNQHVEDEAIFPLSEDVLKIDYPNYSEFIVTDIPERRIELDINLQVWADKLEANKYNVFSQKVAMGIFNNVQRNNMFAIMEQEKSQYAIAVPGASKEMVDARANYTLFLQYFVEMFYLLSVNELKGEKRHLPIRMLHSNEIIDIVSHKNKIFSKYSDASKMYDEYNKFYDLLYKIYFDVEKVYEGIKPNGFCPCGSGKKYKQCCMKKTSSITITDIMDVE